MSIGYVGKCRMEMEDDEVAIYSYSGENWNDGGKSQRGDRELYDGSFIIYKDCLEEPEIHIKRKKMPSGRTKLVEKRIVHFPNLFEHLENRKIVIEKECKNAFKVQEMPIDFIASQLLLHVFERYQLEGELPEKEMFFQ